MNFLIPKLKTEDIVKLSGIITTICTCLYLLIQSSLIFAAEIPDTLIVETTKVKGFSPLSTGITDYGQFPHPDSLLSRIPFIKGVPNSISDQTFTVVCTDYTQQHYQNYHRRKLSKSFYDWYFKKYKPDTTKLTKEIIHVAIVIMAGHDSTGQTVLIVDQNNNYDLSDDPVREMPHRVNRDEFWKKDRAKNLIEVEFEYFDGTSSRKGCTWLFVDQHPFPKKSTGLPKQGIKIETAFGEYRTGEFSLNGKFYSIGLANYSGVVKGLEFGIFHWPADENKKLTPGELVHLREILPIEDYFYQLADVSLDGKKIVLVRDKKLNQIGNQEGMIAKTFSGKFLDGRNFELEKYRGKYVYLDFWGTTCSGCIAEIPKLKKIYKKYKNKDFEIIGIAYDGEKRLKKYLEKEKVEWPQMLYSDELLELYSVTVFPATFLINPKGVIIGRNIHADLLEKKLEEVF